MLDASKIGVRLGRRVCLDALAGQVSLWIECAHGIHRVNAIAPGQRVGVHDAVVVATVQCVGDFEAGFNLAWHYRSKTTSVDSTNMPGKKGGIGLCIFGGSHRAQDPLAHSI